MPRERGGELRRHSEHNVPRHGAKWPRDGRLLAQLAGRIEAPAHHRTVGGLATGVEEARTDGPELDSARDGRGIGTSRLRAVSQLAELVASPAVGSSIGRKPTRVETANRE